MRKLSIILLFVFLFVSFVYAQNPPNFITFPSSPAKLTEGFAYFFDVDATDPDIGDILTYSDNTDVFVIDSVTGVISFTPGALGGGFNAVLIVNDDEEPPNYDFEPVQFVVNRTPSITDPTPFPAQIVALNNAAFNFVITASDPDGDSLNFSSDNSFINITKTSPTTGEIDLTLAELNNLIASGNNPSTVTLTINDTATTGGFPADGIITETFEFFVNDPIIFDPIPANSSEEDVVFTHNISQYITNTIGTVTFSSNESFVNINSNGILSINPTHELINGSGVELNTTYNINITADDGLDFIISQIWMFDIIRVNDLPVCEPIGDQGAIVGETFNFNYFDNVTDEEDPVNFFDNIGFFDINISTGIIDFLVDETMVGVHAVTLTANDTEGGECSSLFQLSLIGNSPPLFPKNRSLDINPIQDLYVDSDFGDSNFPNSNFLHLFGGDPLLNSVRRSYLMFDLDTVGRPSALIEAWLNLTIFNSTGSFGISLHNVSLFNMSFLNISYNNPGNISLAGVNGVTTGVTNDTDRFNVDIIVEEWFNDTLIDRFLGVNLSDEGLTNNLSYYSVNWSTVSQRPILSLNYLLNISDYNWTSGSVLISVF